jgi:hypothetical protein
MPLYRCRLLSGNGYGSVQFARAKRDPATPEDE